MARRAQRESMIGWSISLEDESGRIHSCTLCDVTAEGLFVSPKLRLEQFAPGQRVKVLLQAQDFKLHVGGTVRWVGLSAVHEVDGFGVQLDALPDVIASVLGLETKKRAAEASR